MSDSKYAGFWLRFVAYLIDNIIISFVQSIIIFPALAVFGISIATLEQLDRMSEEEVIGMGIGAISLIAVLTLVSVIISVGYYTIMEASKYQATFGKMALGLKVTDMDGKPLELGKAFLRNISKIISQLIFMIGYIMAAFTEKKQALHDMIADTLVVKK